jgi:flagellar basal body-associated protein FliL
MLMLVVVGVVSLGAGASVPYVMGMVAGGGGESAEANGSGSSSHGTSAPSAHGAPAASSHGSSGGHGDAHGGGHGAAPAPRPKSASGKSRPVAIPFGEAIVNLSDARATRYLRVKMLLAVDEPRASEVEGLLTTQKPFLKSWLIGYLADQSLKDVERSGVNRVRREVRDRFNEMLYPDGEERILDVLFDEYVVQ